MRLKKLMSLVLACAMALSLITVASAADTEVYYIEDFDYETPLEYVDAVQTINANGEKNVSAAVVKPIKEGSKVNTLWWTTGAGYLMTAHNNRTCLTIFKNAFGNNAVDFWGNEFAADMTRNENGYYIHLPAEKWSLSENLGKTYVISYEMTVEPGYLTSSQTHYFEGFTLWGKGRTTAEDGTMTLNGSAQQMQHFSIGVAAATAETTTATEPVAEGDVAGSVRTINEARQKVVVTTEINGDTKTVTTTTTTPVTSASLKPTSTKQNSWGTAKTLNEGTWYRVATAVKADAANVAAGTNGNFYYPTRVYALDGAKFYESNANYGSWSFEGYDELYGYFMSPGTAFGEQYANIKIYTIKNDDFKVYAENTTDVPLNTKSVRIYFSNIVSPATYAAPVVKKNGVAMEEGTYGVSPVKDYIGAVGDEIYSYVDVSFESLEEATTYTVEFPETITNEIGTALTGKNVATFSTKLPDVKLGSLAVVGAANLIADGSLQKATVTLENTTAANKAVALIYAVYGANGQLADVVYVNDEIVANETADIDVELKYAAAGTAKAFVWNNMEALKPYTGTKTLTIAAPAAAE